jgi:hypothetical protein
MRAEHDRTNIFGDAIRDRRAQRFELRVAVLGTPGPDEAEPPFSLGRCSASGNA